MELRWDILTKMWNKPKEEEYQTTYLGSFEIEYELEKLPEEDSLSPARGIINGLLISIPIWVIVGLIVWWVI